MKKKSKQWKWWFFALIAFLIFIILQIPATWLISKFSKNNQTVHNVSGNIWQGQADWHRGALRGTIHWKTRPLDLLLLRFAADVDIHSGNTQLTGIMAYGFGKKVIVRDMNGQIAPETLKQIVNWQWPVNSIQLKDIQFNYKKEQGFAAVDGQLYWGGGALIYNIGDRQDRMNMPSLSGQLTDQNGQLQVDIHDQRNQKMANLLLDANMMLDVQLTQRLLLNVPSYDGKAGLDTFVISSRQPLLQGGN
ncbi:type II secretion system protein N [Acinetobacter baumannii]|uniref:type II secretion system protein N n=1 Tax=Acinetobacter baumannii TaxID=470 RepID=UPI0017A0EBF6|nr:type II secretion system protein N [Acinetobacter baumannii]MCW1508620.1 type II secretion system protein N [Acinetobacter baumannii]MCZ3097913.1 type II secretion system protein N [Acinetobacter baumannii]MDA3361157.1 type II secretion system protein N [Acinetobacter baumannii]MDR9547357.1 type II secretion system protein N [Acinetobacter baumannii]MDV4229078.1 type II secretion system protein N [Acinetobacter baumannii]